MTHCSCKDHADIVAVGLHELLPMVWCVHVCRTGAAEDAMVVFTKHRVWSLADDDSDD